MTKMEEVAFNLMRLINIVDGERGDGFEITVLKTIRNQIVNGEDYSDLVYRIKSRVLKEEALVIREMEVDKDGLIASFFWDGHSCFPLKITSIPEMAIAHGFDLYLKEADNERT